MLGSWLILRWALKQMDPNRNAKALAKLRKKELARRLGRPVNLDGQYEDVRPAANDCPAAPLLLLQCCLPGRPCLRSVFFVADGCPCPSCSHSPCHPPTHPPSLSLPLAAPL